MANLIHISKKIKDMQSILKIAEALQLISSTKLKGYKQLLIGSADYMTGIKRLFEKFYSSFEHDFRLSNAKFDYSIPSNRKFLWIIIGSDLSLCGRFNKQIAERVFSDIDLNRSFLVVFGKKIMSILSTDPLLKEQIIYSYSSEMPFAEIDKKIDEIITLLLREYVNRGCYYLRILYRASDKTVKVAKLLPLTSKAEYFGKNKRSIRYESHQYRVNPAESVIELFPSFAARALFLAIVESKISEHDQRREVMSNAIKSTEEKLAEYNLIYQKMRQSSITQEISEITAALKCKN